MDAVTIFQILLSIVVILIGITLTFLYYTWPYSYFKNLGIPGPKPKPFVGNAGQYGKVLLHDIDIERINKYGKVVGTFEGWQPSLLITDLEMLKEIFIRDFDKFCERRHLEMRGAVRFSVFDTKGAENFKRQRSQLSRYFSSGKMKMNMKTLNEVLDNFLKRLQEKCEANEAFEARSMTDMFTMDAISRTAFGVDANATTGGQSELLKRGKELLKTGSTGNILFLIIVFLPSLAKILDFLNFQLLDFTWFDEFVSSLIKQRTNSKEERSDFVDTLLKAKEVESSLTEKDVHDKGMSHEEIIGNAILFLLAGFDTTASSISFFFYTLAVYQDCQQKIYEEIQESIADSTPTYDNIQSLKYLNMCLDENLRLYPIAVRTERVCVEDTVVKDLPIKKGTLVGLPIWYFHRNPEIYENPDDFIPERFTTERKNDLNPFYYCPFGVGPRHCIGMRLAILEIKLCIVRTLQKFKIVKNEKTQVPLQFKKDAFNLSAQDGVWISLEKR